MGGLDPDSVACLPAGHYVAVASERPTGRVLGVDACKAGWIGIALGSGQVTAYTAVRIDELVATVSIDGPVAVVAIDIPIGLPDAGSRQADDLARAAVGARWPSVFKTPVREALLAPDHVAAIAINRRLAGAGVTAQAFGSGAAVDDVLDAAIAAWTARRVAHGQAQAMPDPPEFFSDNLPAAIWA
jgi:predicted RNase H-like nuclease